MNIGDMFDKQGVIGAKIEKIILEREITKTEVCNETGISKPTLDKLLKGQLTNKVNYDKHIEKIMSFLDLTEEELLQKVKNSDIQIRQYRNLLRISQEKLANAVDIPLERLKKIEEGEEASMAELRDIAMVLSTGVNCLLGKNYFESQIAVLDDSIENNEKNGISGFWGYVGILLMNTDEYQWFPITRITRENTYRTIQQKWIIIPCMNDRVLVINTDNVKEIMLLDDVCDEPSFVNWNYSVDCGNYPLVFYEALEDYAMEETKSPYMSEKFEKTIESIINNESLEIDDFEQNIRKSIIHFKDGKIKDVLIDFCYDDSVVGSITNIYEFESDDYMEKFLRYEDYKGAEILISMDNVSMLELPLVEVEKAIEKMYEEIIGK